MTAVVGYTAAKVAVGKAHICVLHVGGVVECFGQSTFGELGPSGGSGEAITDPVDVTLEGTTQLAAGWQHSCALDDAGVLRCWGRNDYGQAAPQSSDGSLPFPTEVPFAN